MNFVSSTVRLVKRMLRRWWYALGVPLTLAACFVSGCADQVRMPTPEQLAAFERAASVAPTVDMDRIRKAKLHTGPYRVIPGDVLEFTMPALLQAVTAAQVQAAQAQNRQDAPYICRVSNAGTITLPAAGEIEVLDRSVAEIEEVAIKAYERYVSTRPSVFVRVLEYRVAKVYVAGAVQTPGVYTLRADQMTLVSLLTEAGGIAEAGAAVIRIVRSSDPNQEAEALAGDAGGAGQAVMADAASGQTADGQPPAIVLPVVGMNIPFRDIALEEGDTIIVEQGQVPLFSVLGLVRNPGNFPYPPATRYNIMQAIASAGGLDSIADPRYVTIYRLTETGSVSRVPFRLIQGGQFTAALSTPIRPGDLIAVEHTPRTRTNTIINNLVNINTGVYLRGEDVWGD